MARQATASLYLDARDRRLLLNVILRIGQGAELERHDVRK